MAPTPLIPDGIYKIRNSEFANRVADLLYGDRKGRIVGAIERPSNLHDKVCVIRSGGRYSLLQ